jgi:uncharacterized protein YkwD
MRGRGAWWAATAGLVVGTASLSAAASSSIPGAGRVADRAERLNLSYGPELTPEQRTVVELVGLVNIERGIRGLPSLRLDDRASAAARAHAAEMASLRRLQHVGLDGSDGGVRLGRAGFVWSAWGENIGAGFGDPGTLVGAWMDSTNHRANLVGEFTDIGVGVVATADGVPYWSLLVARAPESPLQP